MSICWCQNSQGGCGILMRITEAIMASVLKQIQNPIIQEPANTGLIRESLRSKSRIRQRYSWWQSICLCVSPMHKLMHSSFAKWMLHVFWLQISAFSARFLLSRVDTRITSKSSSETRQSFCLSSWTGRMGRSAVHIRRHAPLHGPRKSSWLWSRQIFIQGSGVWWRVCGCQSQQLSQ